MAHSSTDIDAATKASINSSLKNLMFFTHQNLLIVIQILLNRMINPGSKGDKKGGNFWGTNLQTIINQKMLKKVKTKGEAI